MKKSILLFGLILLSRAAFAASGVTVSAPTCPSGSKAVTVDQPYYVRCEAAPICPSDYTATEGYVDINNPNLKYIRCTKKYTAAAGPAARAR
jgi:hypothetical protein